MHERLQVESGKQLQKLQRKFNQAFWLMQGSFLPTIATSVGIASQKAHLSSEEKGFCAIVLGTEAAFSLLGVAYFVRSGLLLGDEQDKSQKQKKKPLEQIAPLKEYPTDTDEQEYLELQSRLRLHLKPFSFPESNLETFFSDTELKENSRIVAVKALVNEFVNPQRRNRTGSDLYRTQVLDFVAEEVLERQVTSQRGLPLLPPERAIIFDVFHLVFQTEQAPRVVCALVGNLSAVLKSFCDTNRLEQGVAVPSQAKLNRALQDAVRAEKFKGVLSDVPIGIHREAKGMKNKEDKRVLVMKEEATNAAKKLVALCFRVQPEVREKAQGEIKQLKTVLSRLNTPEVKELLEILQLPENFRKEFMDVDNFFRLPEYKPEIRGDSAEIIGLDLSQVDRKACQIGLIFPTLKELKIVITATGTTVRIPMETFYTERLVKGRFWFLTDVLAKGESSDRGVQPTTIASSPDRC